MKLPKKVPNTYQYSFIVGSALRYALHRHSYATGLTARYIQEHWKYLDEESRHNIIRDLRTHIEAVGEDWSKDSLKSVDLRIWQELLEWANIAIHPSSRYTYTPKSPRVDSIPPELCTIEEARVILGLKDRSAINMRSKRFQKLRYTRVCYNKTTITLFNRAEVEALRYKPIPQGYITLKKAKLLLGYSATTSDSTALSCLKKHNIPRVLVKAHHSHLAWQESAVKQLAKQKNNTMNTNRKGRNE